MTKIVSLILARGGSKGVPRKNIKSLNGHPLIYYTITASINSKVNETWISSDDDEILMIANDLGAKTIKRPDEISGDLSSSEEALLHFSDQIDFDILVFLQPTSPLTSSVDINNGLNMMSKYDSVITVSKIPHKVWINKKPIYDLNSRKMRQQETDENHIETGSFYITKKNNLIKSKCRISGKIGFLEIPYLKSFEIDTSEDFKFIELLIKNNDYL